MMSAVLPRLLRLVLSLVLLAPAAVLHASAATVTLSAQTNRVVNELATLTVTNKATYSGSAGNVTNTFLFTYPNRAAFVADGWNFIATNPDGTPRDTEVTDTNLGPLVSYDQTAHPGVLRIPCDVGDMWGNANDTRNSIFRALPATWVSLRLGLNFAPVLDIQQMHLTFYQDDDNFVQVSLAQNSTLGGEVTTMIWEVNETPNHYFTTVHSVTNIHLRLDRNLSNGNITGLYSLNGTSWTTLGSIGQSLVNPRLCIWVGGEQTPYVPTDPNCDLQRLDVVWTNTGAPALSYQLVNAPAGAAINTNGVITWTPTEAQGPSTNVLTTFVTDNGQPAATASNSFTVVVNELNQPPILPSQPNLTIDTLTSLAVTNTATDPDLPPNPLAYQLAAAPPGALIDTTGVITWTAGATPGTNLFMTVVTDASPSASNAQHLSATNSFLVTVRFPPGPALPAQPDMVITDLSPLTVTNTATDLSPGVMALATNSFLFAYSNRTALLADGWSFIATSAGNAPRNTEITNPTLGAVVSYDQVAHPGILRIPCDAGDLWGTANNTDNSLFRPLPGNWISLQATWTFKPAANYQQAHLGLYQDDDNYVQTGVVYRGGVLTTLDTEFGGNATTPNQASLSATATNLHVRLDRALPTGNLTALYSTNGVTWVTLGQAAQAFLNPRVALWTGGALSGAPNLDLQRLDVVVTNTPVPIALSYQLLSPPAGMNISSNGIITWTPDTTEAPSTNLVTTVVTDNEQPPLSATNSFMVVVNPSPPSHAPMSVGYVAESNTIQLAFPGAPTSTYVIQWSSSLDGPWLPLASLSPDASGLVNWSGPAPGDVAFFRVLGP